MHEQKDPWLDWARRLQAIAQNGLHYTDNPFDVERYEEVRAIAAEIAAARLGAAPAALVELFAAERGHATPKVDVRGLAFRDGRVLLVRNRDDGCWSPPGGWAEIGDAPSEAVVKEVREEAGCAARVVALVGVYILDRRDRPRWPFYGWALDFLCEVDGDPGEADPREVSDAGFFGEDELPELSVRTDRRRLARAWAHSRDPRIATYFD